MKKKTLLDVVFYIPIEIYYFIAQLRDREDPQVVYRDRDSGCLVTELRHVSHSVTSSVTLLITNNRTMEFNQTIGHWRKPIPKMIFIWLWWKTILIFYYFILLKFSYLFVLQVEILLYFEFCYVTWIFVCIIAISFMISFSKNNK